jgi:hypothetical protein
LAFLARLRFGFSVHILALSFQLPTATVDFGVFLLRLFVRAMADI